MYLLDPQQQNRLIRDMSLTRKDRDNDESFYYDISSEKMWKSFYPLATAQHLGPRLLRIDPLPESLEECIALCLDDEATREDARGLGIELSTTPQQWQQVITIVEENHRNYNRKKLHTFLKKIQIENYETLFDQLNITFETLELDEDTLNKLAQRSKKIRYKRLLFF